jgi:hypothetical protein
VSTAESHLAAISAVCHQTLIANWREGVRERDGVPFAYTRPSRGRYPFQWYWDSSFAATVWRRFDPQRSRTELETLLAAQREDGFIGHTVFWEHPLNLRQRLTYNVLSPHAPMTSSIQPPTLAWAWRIAVGDPAEVPAICRHYDWLAANRDLDGDGLVWIVQPDESGLDASPQFDAIWGREVSGLPGFVRLVWRNRERGYELRRILARGGPVCCEVMTNVFHGLSQLALGRSSITGTIVERMYDEGSGLFMPLARPAPTLRPAVTWAALSPLALPDLPESIGRRLVEEHLLGEERFWLPVMPPSVAATEPAFSRRDRTFGIKRYWRGPTWMNAAWLVWMGLSRLGYTAQAQHLSERVGGVVAAEGLREYYDPFDGRGMGERGFAWSSLVLEMLEPDARAAWSFVDA